MGRELCSVVIKEILKTSMQLFISPNYQLFNIGMCRLHIDLCIILSTEMSFVHVWSRYRWDSPETKQQVVQLIQNRQMTAYMAAKEYGILKNNSPIYKVAGHVPIVCRSGPDSVLSNNEEKLLVKWALNMCAVSYPVTRKCCSRSGVSHIFEGRVKS